MSQDWGQYALLLIDVQNDFWPEAVASDFPGFEANIGNVLTSCRETGIEVIHIQARFKQDKSNWMTRYKVIDRRLPCIEGTEGVKLLECATPVSGETEIIKQTFDAFLNPELHQYLQENNKQFVFVAGLITSTCVLFTSASAAQRGYLVAVLEDCCADSITAHQHTLDNYPYIFDVTNSRDFVANYDHWNAMVQAAQK